MIRSTVSILKAEIFSKMENYKWTFTWKINVRRGNVLNNKIEEYRPERSFSKVIDAYDNMQKTLKMLVE